MEKLIPQLRFPGCREEWERKLVQDVCNVATGNKDTQNKVNNGLYPFFVRSDNVERINTFSFDGEAVLTSGDGVGVGKNYHYINGKFDYHQRVYCMNNFKSCNGKYFYYYFSLNFYNRVMRMTAKNSVDSVRRDMITKMPISIPSLEEQTKIANFLGKVDKQIEILTSKKEKLEAYKKGIMQQLFNQELRFKKDDGSNYPDWEEKKLADICTFFSGGTPSSTNKSYYNGDIPFIKSGEINKDKTEQFLSQEGIKNSSAKMVNKGDLLYALYGATAGETGIAKISGAINQAVLCVKVIQSNKIYLLQLLKFNKKNIVDKFIQGGQGNLSAKIIKELTFDFPSLEEQTKIANFLSAIDRQIEQVDKQIDKTKAFKKGLLQQMFV